MQEKEMISDYLTGLYASMYTYKKEKLISLIDDRSYDAGGK